MMKYNLWYSSMIAGVCSACAEGHVPSPSLKKKQHQAAQGKVIHFGEREWLTLVLMKKFQPLYGKTICSNVGDSEAMKKAAGPFTTIAVPPT